MSAHQNDTIADKLFRWGEYHDENYIILQVMQAAKDNMMFEIIKRSDYNCGKSEREVIKY